MKRLGAALLALAVVGACRLDPGVPDYSSHEGLGEADEESEVLPGPFPFEPGTERLSLGIFYDGESTDEILINDVDTHYYIFEDSYSIEPSADRVEGVTSDSFTLKGGSFYGGGIIYDNERDLSDWTTLHVSFRSSDTSFEEIPLRFLSGDPDASVEVFINASLYGYVNDGEWHSIVVPLDDVVGFDRRRTVGPFIIGAGVNELGDQLLVDDVYYTKE